MATALSWHRKTAAEESVGAQNKGPLLVASRHKSGNSERNIVLPVSIARKLETSLGRKLNANDMIQLLSKPSLLKGVEDRLNASLPKETADGEMRRLAIPEIRELLLANGAMENYVKIKNTDTFYLEAGNPNSPTLLLVHGMSNEGSYGAWKYIMLELAEEYHVISPDFPGYGNTKKNVGDKGTLAFNINFIDNFVNEIGFEKISIISISMGGWASLGYTLKNPEKVSALVGIGSGGLSDLSIPFSVRALTMLPKLTSFAVNKVRENERMKGRVLNLLNNGVHKNSNLREHEITKTVTSEKIVKFADQFLHGHTDLNAAALEFLHDQLRSSPKEIGFDYLRYKLRLKRMMHGFRTLYVDGLEALNNTKIPYLLIHGSNDPLFALPKVKLAVEKLENHKLIELEDCNHRPHIEHPEEVLGPLLQFLGGEEKDIEEKRRGSAFRSIANALRRAA
ncbi:MAG: alpha/beta hydrolase [Candidatus Micrarchaeota archaeon]|nr:alpha/beta hydrolase [Candidatus Micrarchaeota archaeon]MDE1834188.1 alpha/beta hydrolase [Candidatus Micrarchaeota archaeon]MDE1859160.1 alpha/beta hydrolase [Candidatus Micrarchaeota archaeon]